MSVPRVHVESSLHNFTVVQSCWDLKRTKKGSARRRKGVVHPLKCFEHHCLSWLSLVRSPSLQPRSGWAVVVVSRECIEECENQWGRREGMLACGLLSTSVGYGGESCLLTFCACLMCILLFCTVSLSCRKES